uniref:Protein Ycf2 n=1 Tax=Taiwania flousiana TaxID=99815 RepID=A0A6M3TVH7_9CONI|nr:hypothetical protein [Taiwania flousiana]
MKKHKKTLPMDPIERTQKLVWFNSVQSRFQVNMMEIFVPWNESNLVKLLSQIFSGRESVVKLFDFRILSTLLIRDIRIFILRGQAIKAVMIIALPLLFYFLNSRSLIKRKKSLYNDNFIKIFPYVQHFGARKKSLLLVPHLFMSLPKGKRRYQRRLLNTSDRISENQGTISWESPSKKKSNYIKWDIDSTFNSIQNEYWEPAKEPENLYEWEEAVLHKKDRIEELENKIEQLEKRLVEIEELDFSLKSEESRIADSIIPESRIADSIIPESRIADAIIAEKKRIVKEIEEYKEELKTAKEVKENYNKLFEEMLEEAEMIQKESDRTRESYSFSESEFFRGLFDHLSIDESYMSIRYNYKKWYKYRYGKKPSEKSKFLKRRQDAFRYFRRLEKNRILDLWKVKTYLKNPSVNYDILSDPAWNIRKDINQLNCIRFMNQSLSSRSSSSCDQNKEQLTLNKEKKNLTLNNNLKKIVLKITDQFTLSVTKPNQDDYSEILLNVNDRMSDLYELDNLKIKIFNDRDELQHDQHDLILNILDKKNQLFIDQIRSKDDITQTSALILNEYKMQVYEHFEKAFKRFHLLKNVLMKYSLSEVFKEYSKYSLKLDAALDDLESETALDEYASSKSFQKYYFEWKKIFKRLYIKLLKTLNRYAFQLTKAFHKYYLKFQKIGNRIYCKILDLKSHFESQKIGNRIYCKILDLKSHFESQKIGNRIYCKILDLKSHFESQKIVDKIYCKILDLKSHFESQKIVDKIYCKILDLKSHFESQKIVDKIYCKILDLKSHFESQKIVDKIYCKICDLGSYLELQKLLIRISDKIFDLQLEFLVQLERIYSNCKLEIVFSYCRTYCPILDAESHPDLIKILFSFHSKKKSLLFIFRETYFKIRERHFKYPIQIKYPIRINWIKLNNVTQDAITQHSSSWRKCQKEWFNRSIVRTYENRNRIFDNFVLSIQIEYLEKRLQDLLSISKQKNLKNRVLNPIELWITQYCGNPSKIFYISKIFYNKIDKIISDHTTINPIQNEIKSKSIDEQTIAPLGLNDKPLIQSIIDLLDNGNNYMELANNAELLAIFNGDNWLNPLKLSNQNSLRASFPKANTFEFLDYLHRPRLNYKKRLASYMERIRIKKKNVTYGQLLNLVPIYNNLFFSSIGEIRALYSEKETISLIKSQVNILLDKYLCDQALIHNFHKSSKLLNQLNLFIHSKIDIFSIENYKAPLISLKIVNFDKKSCYPFLSSSDSEEKTSNQSSKYSVSSKIDFIQTQSYQDDLLSEISFRMNKFAEKEKYSSTKNFKNIAIGDLLNKEELKFLFSFKTLFSFKNLQINILLFEKWGLFQKYSSWFWLFTSAGWKYNKKMFLATFPEIPINTIDQLVSIPRTISKNWNKKLNILSALSDQFWTLLKWEFTEKIIPKLNLLLSRWDFEPINQAINEGTVIGKDKSISFDTWKYFNILNVQEYDFFIYIFIGFSFYTSCIIPLWLIKFYRNLELIKDLKFDSHNFQGVGKMMHSFRMLRNFSNISWYGSWLTFLDYAEKESDPDDIGLSLLLKIWYVKNIKRRFLKKYSKFRSIVKKVLYEFEVDDFFLREKRLFSIQEKISKFESKLTPPIGFFHEYFEKRNYPGLLYFRYLAQFIQLGLTHRIGLMNSELNSLSLAEMPIFAAFYQKITSMSIHSSLSDQVRFYPLYPVPSFSNRILLIGPKETGRSYLAKSLAADSYLPLIRISPQSFLRQQKLLSRYEPEFTSSAKESYLEHENILRSLGWLGRPKDIYEKKHYDKKPHKFLYDRVKDHNPPEYFSRRVIQFVFALKLAKLMSPCVIWIPSIHELNDYFFLTALLIELLGDSYNVIDGEKETTVKQNVIVIASTHIPKKIDPFLITPPRSKRRFDTFINTKKMPALHREKEFPLLLRNKGLYLEKEWNCYDEFGLTTKGFTTRDLAQLADEISAINIEGEGKISAIDNNIIGVALYRLHWGPCNYNLKFSEFFKGLPYKIGKAVIQNKLTYLKNFLGLTLDFQGRRGNYLHQWYLEPSIAGTAAKELAIFYHILGCLAGSAAQDCWFLSESNKENWSSPFDPFIANDFILASSLLQGLLEEFPSLVIYRGNSDSITIAPQFKRDTMQKGLSSILDQIVLSKELRNSYGEEEETSIVCDSRTWRFSFIRSNRFEHIKDITTENPLLDYLHLFGRFQERPTRLSSLYWKKFLASRPDYRPVYSKKDDIPERKALAFWEAKFLYNKFERMGIYQFDTEEYATEYKPLDTPVIYLARRFLWDPVSIRFINKHPVFERRELFLSQEFVKTIYLSYSSTRELKFTFKKPLKSIRRRKKVRKIALGIKIQTNDNELPLNIQIEEREDFETFKRFQEIGIRLRRVLPYSQSVMSERWFREKTRDDNFKQCLLKGERENIDLLSNESLIYKTLSESYEYLSNLFFSNTILFKQIINTLLKEKWLSTNAIDCLLAEGLNKNKTRSLIN